MRRDHPPQPIDLTAERMVCRVCGNRIRWKVVGEGRRFIGHMSRAGAHAERACTECGRSFKDRGGPFCNSCYGRLHRADPQVRARHNAAVRKYQKAHAENLRIWRRKYKVWAKVLNKVSLVDG